MANIWPSISGTPSTCTCPSFFLTFHFPSTFVVQPSPSFYLYRLKSAQFLYSSHFIQSNARYLHLRQTFVVVFRPYTRSLVVPNWNRPDAHRSRLQIWPIRRTLCPPDPNWRPFRIEGGAITDHPPISRWVGFNDAGNVIKRQSGYCVLGSRSPRSTERRFYFDFRSYIFVVRSTR